MAEGDERPAEKRRLPVLQASEPARDSAGEPPVEERSTWRWISLGVAAAFLVWLPLSMLVEVAVHPAATAGDGGGGRLWLVGAHALAFATGASAGGFLVGRLGGKAGRREAAITGAGAGALAWLLGVSQGTPGGALTWGLLLALMAGIGALSGALGGALGLRMRKA